MIILLILILLGVVWYRLNKNRPPDYYAFFIIGVIWLPLGLLMGNNVLAGLGLVFLIAGLVNKKKWKENRVSWSQLSEKEKKLKTVAIIILGFLVIIGLTVWYLLEKGFIA
jgi:predicted transporter